MLVAVDTHSMNLQWNAVEQQPAEGAPECAISYSLEMQLMSLAGKGSPAADSLDDRRWSCCFSGQATYAQACSRCPSWLRVSPYGVLIHCHPCRCQGCVLGANGPFVLSAGRSARLLMR